MMEETLFSNNVKRPLADRLRPQSLKEVVGQEHIVGDDAPGGGNFKPVEFGALGSRKSAGSEGEE